MPNFEWLISQASMCCVSNSLKTTLHQETLTLMKVPNLKKSKVSFFWNQVTCSSVHKHENNKNEPYHTVLGPVKSLTHSPISPLKDQPQNVATVVTGCNQALVPSMGTEEEYLVR
jgi:hypothetical protein